MELHADLHALADVQHALVRERGEGLGDVEREVRALRADVAHDARRRRRALRRRRLKRHQVREIERGLVSDAPDRHHEPLALGGHHQVQRVVLRVRRDEPNFKRHLHPGRHLSRGGIRAGSAVPQRAGFFARLLRLFPQLLAPLAAHALHRERPSFRSLDLDPPRHVVVVPEPQDLLVRLVRLVAVEPELGRERLEKRRLRVNLRDDPVRVVVDVQKLDDRRSGAVAGQVRGRMREVAHVLRRRFLSDARRDAPRTERVFVSEPISSGAIRGTDRDGRASSVGRPRTRVRKRRVRRRSGARAAPPCVRSRLARGGRGRSRACRTRALGECRGGEESGRRTHPDVRVRVIALRVRAVLDVRRVRLERRRRHLHAPPSAAAAAHGARLARTRVPVRSIRTEAHPTGPRACSRADELRPRSRSPLARASHAAAVSTTPRRSGAARCAGVRDASRPHHSAAV